MSTDLPGSFPSSDENDTKGSQLKPSHVKGEFFSLFQDHLMAMSRDGRHKEAWRGDDAASYASEMRILQENYSPLLWGIGCSIITFAGFRISKFTGPILRKTNKSGYNFQNVSTSTQNRMNGQNASLLNARSIPTDLALSFLIGCSATLFLVDQDKLFRDMSSVPLVKGRSLISQELCTPFIQKYQQIPRKFWDMNESNDNSLKAIKEFVQNCQKRQIVENAVRQQSSFGNTIFDPSKPVSIPGIPWNLQIDDVDQKEK